MPKKNCLVELRSFSNPSLTTNFYINPLVPSGFFLAIFSLFLPKRKGSAQPIFLKRPPKWPLSVFLSINANLKIIE